MPSASKEIVSHPGIAELRAMAVHGPGPINLPQLHLQLGVLQTHFSDKEEGENKKMKVCGCSEEGRLGLFHQKVRFSPGLVIRKDINGFLVDLTGLSNAERLTGSFNVNGKHLGHEKDNQYETTM